MSIIFERERERDRDRAHQIHVLLNIFQNNVLKDVDMR